MPIIRRLLPAILLVAAFAAPLRAQIPGAEITQVRVTRGALDTLLQAYEQASRSPAFSQEVRNRHRRTADLIRARLTDGDFQVGDRVLLEVAGETALTDTFTVEPRRILRLPNVGEIPLHGILRSELTDHVTRILQQFLRDPRVRTQALIRITVMGAVTRLGFYTVPVEFQVSDVLEAAGIAGNADLIRMSIERGGEVLWEGEDLLAIITEGRTLDAMSIQAGDRFMVPPTRSRNPLSVVQTLSILLSIPFSIAGLIALVR
jgi:protein involved in polysaccharide export with SLBB domain